MNVALPAAPHPAEQRRRAWLDTCRLADVADAWLALRSEPPAQRWRRDYARHQPDADPWAVCVLQADDGRLVRIEAQRCAQPDSLDDPVLGPLRLAAFPADPALPGLAKVVASLHDSQVVRYRPGKRCTLRGWTADGERFVKVTSGGERLYRDGLTLWHAYRTRVLSTAVAQPHAWDEATQALWQGVVAGRPILPDLLGAAGDKVAHRLGFALAELATSGCRPTLTHDAAVQLGRTRRAMQRTSRIVPALGRRLQQFDAQLARRHASLTPATLVPVHGAPHAHQWLIDADRLGLIDFDRFALGEPEFDLATFVAELDTERGLSRPVQAIEQAMIDGYAAGGVTIDPRRTALYRAHKRLSKVLRTAFALRSDAAERAAHLLDSAQAALDAA